MTYNSKQINKEKIYRTAASLFAKNGYENTTMRELANDLGISGASLYNHFPGKREILLGLYDEFAKMQEEILPDIESVLKRAETEPPLELLMSMNHYFPSDSEGMMCDVIVTAASKMSHDPKSAELVGSSIMKTVNLAKSVIYRLVELGRIEPLDVEAFSRQLLHVRISAAAQHALPTRLNTEQWTRDFRYLHELVIKPTG